MKETIEQIQSRIRAKSPEPDWGKCREIAAEREWPLGEVLIRVDECRLKGSTNHRQVRVNSDGSLLCPVCGAYYTHLLESVPIPDDDDRRESVALKFYCEEGCNFTLCFVQHEGITCVVWVTDSSEAAPAPPPAETVIAGQGPRTS